MKTMKMSDKEMDRCAHVCHECQDACLETLTHCLGLGGTHAGAEHIGMLMDCIAICGTSHDLLHRGSMNHEHTCRACAAICEACAADCEELEPGDKMMAACAEKCRACAASCRKMSGN